MSPLIAKKGFNMKFKILLSALFLILSASVSVQAQEANDTQEDEVSSNMMDELNPFDPNIEEVLNQMDLQYMEETGEIPFLGDIFSQSKCYRSSCPVWLQVVKSQQKAYLYRNGSLQATWYVSTGVAGFGTPNFDTNPNGRIYDKYTSTKYPGGDYNGLGNMPYAVFISGGFAVHGTAKSNWKKLGRTASHGCIRLHPDNAYLFNRLVRQYGIRNTWITVQ